MNGEPNPSLEKSEKGETLFEISITFLPIALLFIMFAVFGDWRRVLEHEEWLFVSAVLQAQALGKLFVASDHAAIKNKPMLYTVALFLVLGIVWCSMTVAKNLVPLKGGRAPERILLRKLSSTNLPHTIVTTGPTNSDESAQVIEEKYSVEDISHQSGGWTIAQNFFAVFAASVIFAWASTVERKSRKGK